MICNLYLVTNLKFFNELVTSVSERSSKTLLRVFVLFYLLFILNFIIFLLFIIKFYFQLLWSPFHEKSKSQAFPEPNPIVFFDKLVRLWNTCVFCVFLCPKQSSLSQKSHSFCNFTMYWVLQDWHLTFNENKCKIVFWIFRTNIFFNEI